MVESIPPEIKSLLVKLQVIGMTESGQKLSTRTQNFTYSNSWYGAIIRWFNRENRSDLLLHLDETIQFSLNLLESEYSELLSSHLKLASYGIKNMTRTYIDDSNMVAHLNVLIETIKLKVDISDAD